LLTDLLTAASEAMAWRGCRSPQRAATIVAVFLVLGALAGVSSMKRKNVIRAALHRAALRSAKASAELERRGVPAGYVRSEKVNRFLAARHQSA
jgi:hypothetical protein